MCIAIGKVEVVSYPTFQHIVSMGAFGVLVNVLFVIVSPIDANPFDELE